MKEIIIDGVTYICMLRKALVVEHEFVDLGLHSERLWATCNIGAEKPTDYGDLFACGAVEPFNMNKCDIGCFNGTDAANLPEMDDKHDVAKVLWGDNWRMPTLTDFAELIDNCTYVSEVIDGITCGVFTSKVNNQKIVMPPAGYVNSGALIVRGVVGFYWSMSFGSSELAWSISFGPGGRAVDTNGRYIGFSVRPVRS